MSELRVRDHSQPCEHDDPIDGAFLLSGQWVCSWTQGRCPGGREIVLRRVYTMKDSWGLVVAGYLPDEMEDKEVWWVEVDGGDATS